VESHRILVIDDDPALLESLSAALCPPWHVLPALTLQAARALLETMRADLVLLDLCLGEEDGAGLIPEIRRRTDAPILLMTGFGTHANLVRSIRARPDDFLEKPFDMHELRRRVAALLGAGRAAPDRLDDIRRRIEREHARRLPLQVLARQAGLSARELRGLFMRRFGVTPHAYQVECRMQHAAALLSGARVVKQVAVEVGYASPNNFSAAFKRLHGLSPSAFRSQARQAR
jgi:AraC-like DNA-binding protein